MGGVIHGSQTNALPVNGRYWASLMALIPGAVSSGTGTQDAIRFAGLSQEDNNFRFDGVDATGLNHQFVKEPARLQFPLESIAEFKASSAVYSADVGGMAGGQVSMVSKGGTNNFHGSAYEYLRNSFFDAKAFDSPAVAPFRMNNFGASFGGPIIRNKLFFFTNYEAVRQVFSQQVSGFVPTDAYRAQVAQKSPALAPLINAFPKGHHSYRRSERAAVDQQRTKPHQRGLRTLPHRLCPEQRDYHQSSLQYGQLPHELGGAGREHIHYHGPAECGARRAAQLFADDSE